ncbi:MAG: uracil-DNA glycosylase [Pseudomonadota bacterium]|nr:uracil-DNA glycosylase [Pseudomonadota bacterium]
MTQNSTLDHVKLPECWKSHLAQSLQSERMQGLRAFLSEEVKKAQVFPPSSLWFHALNTTKFDDVKVVILGQDPYHGEGQAHGLSFSVQKGIKPPPSLKNMYKELSDDVGFQAPEHGCLEEWADQGVLLLNSVLTVEKSKPASHQKRGWEEFTDDIIQELSEKREGLVFILWGAYAQKKGAIIDASKHLILQSPHPSPFSARHGFFGCKHFSKTNAYLESIGKTPINWQLSP